MSKTYQELSESARINYFFLLWLASSQEPDIQKKGSL